MKDMIKGTLLKKIRNSQDAIDRLQVIERLSKEEVSDRLFSSSVKCRGINPVPLATLWRDRGDVYLDCRSWIFGDQRLEFIFKHQYREIIFSIEALNILLREARLTIYTSDPSIKSTLQEFFSDNEVLFQDVTSNSLANEYLYVEQTVLDLETLMVMIAVLEEIPSYQRPEEFFLPKIVSLYGGIVDEVTASVSPHMTYLEFVESYGQVSHEPYGLVIDSIVGNFYYWNDIRTTKISDLSTYVGVVHCLSSKEELDILSDQILLSYSCEMCLSCTYLKRSVLEGQKRDGFRKGNLFKDLSKINVENAFKCSLPKRYFAMGHDYE